MIPSRQASLAELINDLETAVRTGDRPRALELERLILQRLRAETVRRTDLELRLRALVAELDRAADNAPTLRPEEGLIERGGQEAAEHRIVPIWFATNRRPNAAGDGFTGERSGDVTHGRVDVFVPKAHRFGETRSSVVKRLLRRDMRDDRLRLQRLEKLGRKAFFAEVTQLLQSLREDGTAPQALVFLHGYNVDFEEAAIRAAQIHVDLDIAGVTAFFSWPSRGSVLSYAADEASMEASEGALTEFLIDFAARCGAAEVSVIAHSMGNRGLMRALQRIAGRAELRSKVRFRQLFLAAPDVDRDLFLELAHLYVAHADSATLYASRSDRAVHLSSVVHAAPRAGYFAPFTVAPGIDTVAVPDFDIDLLGHSYFAGAAALLHDIYDSLRFGAAPPRQRMQREQTGEGAVWRLRL